MNYDLWLIYQLRLVLAEPDPLRQQELVHSLKIACGDARAFEILGIEFPVRIRSGRPS